MFMGGRIVSGANNLKKISNWLKQIDKRLIISRKEKPKGRLQAWQYPGAQEMLLGHGLLHLSALISS